MKNRVLAILAIIVLAGIVLLFSSAIKSTYSTDETGGNDEIVLGVVPPAVMNYSKVPGEKFYVNVTALKVASLHGFEMRLSFDAAVIDCIDVQEGTLLRTFGNTTTFYTIDNTLGGIFASVNLTSPEAAATGNGTLVRLAFSVETAGETGLHLYDVSLFGSDGSSLPYVTYDGYFNNKLNFDIAMPLALFGVTIASMFLNGKVEGKLKSVLEEREFSVRHTVLLVGVMAVMIGLVVFVREMSLALMVLFLFSYSMLLFTFGYLFSKNRWYVAVVPPAVFILLFMFLRDSLVWTYYLSNICGVIFAILITLYLSSLYTWKTTAVFGILLTVLDIILVLVTGTMIEAANTAKGLNLPVFVSVPLVPLILTGNGMLLMSLGLGDFFFAGLLAIQTFKKYGKSFALLSVQAMAVSFFIFEAFLLTFNVKAFPGTLMIICGWIPLVLLKSLRRGSILKKMYPTKI